MPIANLDFHPRPIKILFLTHRGLLRPIHLFLQISIQILTSFTHRPLLSSPCPMDIHLTMRLGGLNPLNSLQFLMPHRKINPVTVVLHLEVATMGLNSLNPLQISTPFNHRFRSNLGKVVIHL